MVYVGEALSNLIPITTGGNCKVHLPKLGHYLTEKDAARAHDRVAISPVDPADPGQRPDRQL
jgi:hypothetical protein